jgi:hypothetical protein
MYGHWTENLHNPLPTINYHDNIVSEIKIYIMKFLGRFDGSFHIYVLQFDIPKKLKQ